ncbi:MAG: hypothetical protein CL607_19500 [Anaerolineaceae bacterium]|nr:hypothetical protein [Anaerolineaceae bacterium]MAU12017.1 hypothetical protein [Anaerolineaceae bacterium]
MKQIKVLALCLGLLLIFASSSFVLAQDDQADMIFYNGTILTIAGDVSEWEQEALAVQGDEILAVGSLGDIESMATSETQWIDLDGRTLMPGIVDPHTHMLNDYGGSLDEAMKFILQNGYTTIGNAYSDESFVRDMVALDAAGGVSVRTTLYMTANDNCGSVFGNWWADFPPTFDPDDMLRTSGVKIFADGGTCGSPALSYIDEPPFLSEELAVDLVQTADDLGYQVLFHAIGDKAIDVALQAINAVNGGGPNTMRHRIDHNAVTRPDQIPLYGAYDIVTVVFASFSFCEAEPTDYTIWEWRWRDLLATNPGLHMTWHGDWPWVSTANPFESLYSMVTPFEISVAGECPTPAFLTAKQLPVETVLRMMTSEAAYALFRENDVGTLESGKFADMIVISANPMAVAPADIKDIDILATYVGGEALFCTEAFCS